MANLTRNYSKNSIDRVNKFFNRENVYKQLKTMVSFLIPHKKNVKLSLNIGGGSYTDGKSITVGLPEMFIEKSYGEIFSALRALIGHESQHINSSDFKAFVNFQDDIGERFYKTHKIPQFYGKKVAKHLFNSVEDGRIEKILCNKLPGYTKHIKFLNGSFWDAQEMKGNSELEDFLHTITTYSVTGLYPKGFKDVYKGTELHENMKKIEADIHSGIDAVTCKQCVFICHDIIDKVEDYLVELLKKRSNEDEEFMRNIPEQSEFTTSEEKEKNTSDSVSTHFVPRKKKEEETEEGDGSESGEDDKEKKSKKKGTGKGKKKEEESEDDEENEGSSKDEGEESESEKEKSGSGKSDDEKSDDDSEDSSQADSDDESGEEAESGDSKGDSGDGSTEDEEPNGDTEEEGATGDTKSGGESEDESDTDADDEPEEDNDFDGIPESTNKYPKGMKQPEEDDILEIDEEQIREQMKEITDEVMEEAKSKLRDDSSSSKKTSSKKDMVEEITEEELMEVANQYRRQTIKHFKEIKGFNQNHTLPVEIKREGSKFRKEVEKIFRNKETLSLRSQRKGVLDTANLYKFGMKDYNMFMKKGTPITTDYVAFILQDGSGSMQSDGKEFYSAKAMSVMEEGLKGIMPFKISTFSVDWTSRGVIHYTAKDWNENTSSKNYSYSFHRSRRATGGNKDGYSIRVATAELLRRPEKDRILVILSDGLPSDYDRGQQEGMVDVKNAVKEARKKGIHVVSLIFGTEDFRDYNIENYKYMYDKNIISCQPEQITNNLVKMLKKIISR